MLAKMARALPASPGSESGSQAAAAVGLHVRGIAGRSGLEAASGHWAAIEGYPRWTTAELASLAAEKGHGAALWEAYHRHGAQLLQYLAGPFSLAVIEPESQLALLAVDRFGVHTMCWAQPQDGGLTFGSTTQAVRAHPSTISTITPQGIYEFLYCYVCPAPTTIYREQSKLLPAQCLIYENGQARTESYWRMPYVEDGPGRLDDLTRELHDRLEQATRRMVEGENLERAGAFLSGGLDSSTVAGMMRRVTERSPKTFTVVFEKGPYDESYYADIAARHFDAKRYDYQLTPRDVLDLIPEVARVFDEPFGNSSAIPAYYCAKAARENGIEVLLAGDGGDELFGGNERYVSQKVFESYDKIPAAIRALAIESIASRLAPLGGPFRKARNFIRLAQAGLPKRLEAYNFWDSVELQQVFTPECLTEIDPGGPLEHRRQIYQQAGSGDLVQRMMHYDLTVALADNDLRKVSRMCELAGVRVRYPYLDEDLAEFSARIPPALLIKGRQLRYFYKEAMRGFLPPETLSKAKHGFGMPFEEWVKQDAGLRALARDALMAFKTRGYFRDSFIQDIVDAHAHQDRSPYDGIVWDIVMLELWLQAHK